MKGFGFRIFTSRNILCAGAPSQKNVCNLGFRVNFNAPIPWEKNLAQIRLVVFEKKQKLHIFNSKKWFPKD